MMRKEGPTWWMDLLCPKTAFVTWTGSLSTTIHHPLSPFLPSLEGARPRTPPHRTYETRRVSADGNRYQGWVSTTRRDDWIMWGLHIELSRDRSMSDETEGVRRKGCWWTAGVSRAR